MSASRSSAPFDVTRPQAVRALRREHEALAASYVAELAGLRAQVETLRLELAGVAIRREEPAAKA